MTALPSLFISHGAPTFAIEPGLAGIQLRELGRLIETPRAVVVISPHWMTPGIEITAADPPGTLHDFGGFPRALYSLQYRAPGSPALAARIELELRRCGLGAQLNTRRGLDHGAWVPLMHLYPDAQIPVIQVSLPLHADEDQAWALGQALAPLAQEGLLIVGSGSLTHNLREIRMDATEATAYAAEFSDWVRQVLIEGQTERLRKTLQIAPHARRAHPTTEHFLPLLVAAGAASWPTQVTVLDGDIRYGVLSMESYVLGRAIKLSAAASDRQAANP